MSPIPRADTRALPLITLSPRLHVMQILNMPLMFRIRITALEIKTEGLIQVHLIIWP